MMSPSLKHYTRLVLSTDTVQTTLQRRGKLTQHCSVTKKGRLLLFVSVIVIVTTVQKRVKLTPCHHEGGLLLLLLFFVIIIAIVITGGQAHTMSP